MAHVVLILLLIVHIMYFCDAFLVSIQRTNFLFNLLDSTYTFIYVQLLTTEIAKLEKYRLIIDVFVLKCTSTGEVWKEYNLIC